MVNSQRDSHDWDRVEEVYPGMSSRSIRVFELPHPTTRSLAPAAPVSAAFASLVSEMELVLDPKMVGAGRIPAKRLKRPFFISGISGIA